ncbi:DegT/DnrJ/EryC1/StrS family aminotransferase [Bradyrhizobium sp. S69]|uniref:DegT/DnrJ/EryC1/StrS family aminotransferase n=1 Tax=Bradyrhizobium sp. S69 TaxID=1641856 RepID=UPI00131E8C18|nr:DegT/DnrJ/EryC1/StrS family aminotransferase [Bradyrhizobium sp. S69]
MKQIPLNDLKRQTLEPQILAAMNEVVISGSFVLGEQVSSFEAEFAFYTGTRDCVGVANGTDALELALRALGCGPGSEVVTVANAGMYASAATAAIGATPVFADINPATMTMDPNSLRRCMTLQTKAVIVTHLYGQLAAIEELTELAAGQGVSVVEDCAQAHGAERNGRRAGSWGAVGCFSFYPTKNLGAIGDGGAIVTNGEQIGRTLRALRQYGWASKYEAAFPYGRNSRLDEIQAAVLRVKLPHLDRWNARRREIVRRYGVAAAPEIKLPDALDPAYVAHLCVARTRDRQALRDWLAKNGISTGVHYPVPDYQQVALQGIFRCPVPLAATEHATQEILTLPCFPEMSEDEILRVCDALHTFSVNA